MATKQRHPNRDCQRLAPLLRAILEHPDLDAAERCLALHGLKQALCPCYEVCDRWSRLMAAGAA